MFRFLKRERKAAAPEKEEQLKARLATEQLKRDLERAMALRGVSIESDIFRRDMEPNQG